MINLKARLSSVDFFMLHFLKVCLILSFTAFISSCKKDVDSDCPNCPRVTAITPNAAHFGDTVVVSGTHLLPNPDLNDVLQVKFNGNLIPDEYILSNDEISIQLIIPKGTPSGPVTVDINVEDELVSAGSVNFTYLYKYTVSTFAGSGASGTADSPDLLLAQFGAVRNLTINPVNNDLIVLDGVNTVRQVSTESGVTTLITFIATWSISNGIACDASGQMYVSTYGISGDGCRIKKMIYSSGWNLVNYAGVNNVCGYADGNLSSSTFNQISDMLIDENNNMVVAESYDVRKITSGPDTVSTLAGTGSVFGFMDGTAGSALFWNISALDKDVLGNIYIADGDNHRIRRLSGGMVSTIAGTGTQGYSNGSALSAQLTFPAGIALDNLGNLYFTDGQRHSIRKLNLNTSQVSVFAGPANGSEAGYADGDVTTARFNNPTQLAFNKNLNILYIIDSGNHMIRQITFE